MKETPTTDIMFFPRQVVRDGKPSTVKILRQRFERDDGTSHWRDVPTYKGEATGGGGDSSAGKSGP